MQMRREHWKKNNEKYFNFNQDRLSIDKSGYSDVSGALRIAGVYHQIFERAANNNLYNMQPTLKFTGIHGSPIDFV